MDLEFTSDQEELRDSVRSFLQKECPTDLVRSVVETGEPAKELWASMVALDWPALAIAEEYGGVGLSFIETAVVAEELGRVIAPGPLLATMSQFVPLVREIGTADQRHAFLSKVASGDLTGCIALADHPRRWGLDDVTMQAERSGEVWVLTGTKYGVMADETTDELVVIARADGRPRRVRRPRGRSASHAGDRTRPIAPTQHGDLRPCARRRRASTRRAGR